jgi:predicted PurR-regulated permease PerM
MEAMKARKIQLEISFAVALKLAFAFVLAGFAAFLVWELAEVLLLVFAAILVALVFRGCADVLERHTPLNMGFALAATGLLLAGLLGGFGFLLGQQIAQQVSDLVETLPQRIDDFGARIGVPDLADQLLMQAQDVVAGTGFMEFMGASAFGLVEVLASVALAVVTGIYLAIRPHRYRRGVLLLLPEHMRGRADETVVSAGNALKLWLLGQLAIMVIVGVATTLAMLALGMPSALALGLIAGVLEFIPFLGPILAAVPAVLIALGEGDGMVFWVLGAYIIIQQLEENIIVPLVQRRAVKLPPALGLFSILALGVLFGPIGILLGTPLTVLLMVLVSKLYVRQTLKSDVSVPGEPEK